MAIKVYNIAVVLYLSSAIATNPGLRLGVTKTGLNYANKVAVDEFSKRIKSSQIPDQSGSGNHITYSLTQIIVKDFQLPQSTIQLVSGNSLQWNANGILLGVNGNFRYKYKNGIIKFSGHGGFELTISDVSFGVGIQIGANVSSGTPTIKATKCSCNIGSVKLKFTGDLSWLYNLFSGMVGNQLSGLFRSKVCEEIQNVIDKQADGGLATMKVEVPIGKDLMLNYKLLSAPTVTAEYIEADLKGEIFWKTDKTEAPFSPKEMAPVKERKMICLSLSDYAFNTLTYQAHQHNMLVFNLTSKNIKNDKNLLNTTCSGICIGKLLPQIGKAYPNSVVELQMSSSDPPVISILQGKLDVSAKGNVKLYARKPDKSLHYLFNIFAIGSASVNISMKGETLHGKLEDTKIQTNVTDSKIGPINDEALQFLVNSAIKITVTPMINDLGQKGFPLPSTDNLEFQNTDVQLLQNTIFIETDVKYIPDPGRKQSKSTVLKFVPKVAQQL